MAPPPSPKAIVTAAVAAGKIDAVELLQSHRAALIAMVAANSAAHVDVPGRFSLDGLTDRARNLIRIIDRELLTPDAIVVGLWGENGKAPLLRAMVRDAKRMREMSAIVARDNQNEREAA
jgi:hypothetical protein